DIGDEQSIDDDLSTFSSHMKNMVTILNETVPGSLVLLDELGGATNPTDGEAIALAVLQRLTEIRTVTFATTHHAGLKVFAHDTDGVANASMEFDREHIRPTFTFRMGLPGSSYAFEIASRMGMPDDVLAEAESITGGDRKSLEGLITEMEEHVRQADEERKLAELARIKAETARKDYESKLEQFDSNKREMMSEAIAESQELLKSANRTVETAVREIKEKKAARDTIIEAKTSIEAKTT
ncbi:endonuclease MutS2, partial [Candidatus Latescibacterota bacterium]